MIGPIHYEIVEPLQAVRFRLEANDAQPLAFDWLFEGVVPPFTEERTHLMRDYRLMSELVRYHQVGTASGWIELDGQRIEMTPDTWTSTRDHSWGVRYDVGLPPTDVEPNEGILQHQRKRKMELKCLELEELLQEQGYKEEEIAEKESDF